MCRHSVLQQTITVQNLKLGIMFADNLSYLYSWSYPINMLQRIKESKSKQRKVSKTKLGDGNKLETPKSNAVQLSITQFYRSTKSVPQRKPGNNPENSSCSEGKSKESRNISLDLDRPLPKSVETPPSFLISFMYIFLYFILVLAASVDSPRPSFCKLWTRVVWMT